MLSNNGNSSTYACTRLPCRWQTHRICQYLQQHTTAVASAVHQQYSGFVRMTPGSSRSARRWAPLILILCFVFLSIYFGGQFGGLLRSLYIARTLTFVFVAKNRHRLTLSTGICCLLLTIWGRSVEASRIRVRSWCSWRCDDTWGNKVKSSCGCHNVHQLFRVTRYVCYFLKS